MELKVPETLRLEHLQLREQLYILTKENSDLGAAARAVMELFYMHAAKEEERVFPAIDALHLLAEGKITDSMKSLKDIADVMKTGLYEELLENHRKIVTLLKDVSESALSQDRKGCVEFVEDLIMHTKMEEEILYPAALVTAEYFQLLAKFRSDPV